jgi:L-amino acid N-acyltransferase YncA
MDSRAAPRYSRDVATQPTAAVSLRVVDAAVEHLEAIASIYADVVRSSPATFDLEPPPIEWWRDALAHVDPRKGRQMLVALDPDDAVLGYAKSGPFKERGAYWTTCETSVYVGEAARGRGVGAALYAVLFERLDRSPLRLAVAGITQPNPASTALHRSFGFERVGTFENVGVKFGRPWSVTWYQRPLG